AVAADAVARVLAVQTGAAGPGRVQLPYPVRRALPQLLQRAELDGLGGAGLGAGRFHAGAEPVVAQGALPGASVLGPPLDDPVRAGGHAVAAAVADVLLHDDGAELGTEQRARRAHVEAGGVGAVLAHVGRH